MAGYSAVVWAPSVTTAGATAGAMLAVMLAVMLAGMLVVGKASDRSLVGRKPGQQRQFWALRLAARPCPQPPGQARGHLGE